MALGKGHSLMTSIALGAAAGAGLGVLEMCTRALLLGSLPWAPADPGAEVARASLFVALLYAPPGALLAALCSRWLSHAPRCSRALAVLPALGLLTAAALSIAWHQPQRRLSDSAAPHGAPSVLVITLDTTRVDAIGAWGNPRARTPNIDALVACGVRFADASVQSILTGPSHTSILSGQAPHTHGVTENSHLLAATRPTLPDTLGRAGYATGAFVAGYPVKQRSLGLLTRFDQHSDDFRRLRFLPCLCFETLLGRRVGNYLEHHGEPLDPRSRQADSVTNDALEWLGQGGKRPFFAWVHYFDAHLPYTPPRRLLPHAALSYSGPADGRYYELSRSRRDAILASPAAIEHMRDLYDASIAYIDEQLGRLLAAARERAGGAGLWIVVTADHGESFGEHDIWYQRDLYQDSVHVPLIFVPPGALEAPRVVGQAVRSIDIAPTLYEALGVAPPGKLDGVSLLAFIEGKPPGEVPESYAAMYPSRGSKRDNIRLCLRNGAWKALWKWTLADGKNVGMELYDVLNDPRELDNRFEHEQERFEALRTRLDPRVLAPKAVREPLSPHDLDVLRSLGYAR